MTGFKKFLHVVDRHKKLIYGIYNFFGSGHFSIYVFWKKWSKNDRSKKIFCIQKSSFSFISNAQKNFWNPCLFSQFLAKALIELSSTNFKAKILKMVLINTEFQVVSMVNTAPESLTNHLLYCACATHYYQILLSTNQGQDSELQSYFRFASKTSSLMMVIMQQ